MPYINKKSRLKIEFCLGDLNAITGLSDAIKTEGDLNYVFTRLCLDYLERKGEKYSTYNTLIGVLECSKQELYRKKISKYEDKKEKENGTVW